MNSPQEAELGNDANLRDHKDLLGRLELPTAEVKEVEASNTDDEPPGLPDSHPEATPEPMAMESPTDSLVPAPDSEEAGICKSTKASGQPQAIFGILGVRQRWVERITWQFTTRKITIGRG